MPAYELVFPDYLVDYEHETESKGYLVGVTVRHGDEVIDLVVYDPTRLAQEVQSDIESDGWFAGARLLVVPRVTREEIARAVEGLAAAGFREVS